MTIARQGAALGVLLETHEKGATEMIINGVERKIEPFADLQGADLRRANLQSAYLQSADLRLANLQGADLRDATIGEHIIQRLVARATRVSDGYEFLLFATETGSVIRAGCHTFIPEEFRAHVAAEYPGTPKAARTLAILDYLEGELRA